MQCMSATQTDRHTDTQLEPASQQKQSQTEHATRSSECVGSNYASPLCPEYSAADVLALEV